jgi:hypothetical protein
VKRESLPSDAATQVLDEIMADQDAGTAVRECAKAAKRVKEAKKLVA